MKKEVIAFVKPIQPNETVYLSERVKYNGNIERVIFRFYAGVEKALQVRSYVLHDGRKPHDFITYPEGVEKYISGDNDTLDFPVTIALEYDDVIRVDVTNNNSNYVYDLVCYIVLNYDNEVGE